MKLKTDTGISLTKPEQITPENIKDKIVSDDELRKAKEALTYWNSDTALWEKHQMVIPMNAPLPQTELQDAEVQPINTD